VAALGYQPRFESKAAPALRLPGYRVNAHQSVPDVKKGFNAKTQGRKGARIRRESRFHCSWCRKGMASGMRNRLAAGGVVSP